LAVVLPDATFNRKAEGQEYLDRPVTFFSEAYWSRAGGPEGGLWLNVNPTLRLHQDAGDLDFTYEQVSGGMFGSLPLTDTWRVSAELRAEEGSREWQFAAPGGAETRHLDRSHFAFGVEFERPAVERLGGWFGARYFELIEDESRTVDMSRDGELSQRETTFFAGIYWRWHERVLFWPGVYVSLPDNVSDFPEDPSRQREQSDVFGKITAPVEISFAKNGYLTLNLTLRLDEPSSGGGNIQVYYPF